jgi:protein-tyrosine phosphatase
VNPLLGWLTRRQRDGGVDRVALPGSVAGELWLCGKHAIAPDPEALLAEVGGDAIVVCLVERGELARRYPDYVAWLDAENGRRARWHPIADFHAPPVDEMGGIVADVVGSLMEGRRVVVHCGAGIGRTGTTAVCVLVALGAGLDDALAAVSASRPGAGPEIGAQRALVRSFAARAEAAGGTGS